MCIQGELNQKKFSCLKVQVKQGTGAGAISREDERGNLLAERGCCRRQSRFLHVRHDGLFCMSTKFNTALVKTPQGGEVVRTLENCEMKEKGYRVSQEIDAGRCLGSCSSGDPCLLRESQSRKKCLVWAEAASGHCTPHRYDIHTFRSRRERARTVVAIRQRKCRG
ncbi:uncharacterized protein LOC134526368 isoform X3 [Chroicocephalus ridibundus]|uniref:uncharacterized protein LOC134526368 isoform X3 n=1 Tax=Chroicocephalus ridibundus TaxID=1192867 RepID=UPI002FDEC7F8